MGALALSRPLLGASTGTFMASTTLTRPTMILMGPCKHTHASATVSRPLEWHAHGLYKHPHCLYKHFYGLYMHSHGLYKHFVGILPDIFSFQSRRLLTKIFKSEIIRNWNCRCCEVKGEGHKTGGCLPFSSIKPGTRRAGLTGRFQNPSL